MNNNTAAVESNTASLGNAKSAVILSRALLAAVETEIAMLESAHPAKAICDRIGAEIDALEPEDFGGDVDAWDAACSAKIKDMGPASDELYAAMAPHYARRDVATCAVRKAESVLVELVERMLPTTVEVPRGVVDLCRQAATGTLPDKYHSRIVDICLRWSGR